MALDHKINTKPVDKYHVGMYFRTMHLPDCLMESMKLYPDFAQQRISDEDMNH